MNCVLVVYVKYLGFCWWYIILYFINNQISNVDQMVTLKCDWQNSSNICLAYLHRVRFVLCVKKMKTYLFLTIDGLMSWKTLYWHEWFKLYIIISKFIDKICIIIKPNIQSSNLDDEAQYECRMPQNRKKLITLYQFNCLSNQFNIEYWFLMFWEAMSINSLHWLLI